MFTLVWHFFPGPAWVRIIAMLILLAVLVWALMFFIYPALQELLPSPTTGVEESIG